MCQRGLRAHVPKCQTCASFSFLRANVPINMLTCHRCANCSAWCANMPKANQLFNFTCQKAYQFFLFFKRIFQFMNFSIMVNICKFQEYLGNCRKPISQIKEFKFWHLQNFIKEKPCQPNAFGVVFYGVRGINRTIISASVKWSWIYFFIYSVCKQAYLEKHIFLKKHSC